jgi:hypothetical protein
MLKIMMSLVLSASLSIDAVWAETPVTASAPAVDMKQIDNDLEDLLTTKEEIKSEVLRDNLSLLATAIKYNKQEAVWSVMISMVICYLLGRESFRLVGLYGTNLIRLYRGTRAGKRLSEVKLVEDNTFIALTGIGISLTASGVYVATNLWTKGVCIVSCPDSVMERITDSQEKEFLNSPTYATIQREIGERDALQFLNIVKAIRASSYSNMDPYTMMGKFVESLNGKPMKSFAELNMPGAPTFSAVVDILNRVYKLNAIVFDYMEHAGMRQTS